MSTAFRRRLGWLILLGGSLLASAARAQTPDPLLLPAPLPTRTLLDLPVVGGLEADEVAEVQWPVPVVDYPLGLTRAAVRARRIRRLTFQGLGQETGGLAGEPDDMIWGHDIRRYPEEINLASIRPTLSWRYRYEYDSAGRLREAEGRQRDYRCPRRGKGPCRETYGQAYHGWRLRKHYDARQRLVHVSFGHYGHNTACPDTLLARPDWQRWLRYDAAGRLTQVVQRDEYQEPLPRPADRGRDSCRLVPQWRFDNFRYNPRGQLQSVRSYQSRDSTRADSLRLVQQTYYDYDPRGRLRHRVLMNRKQAEANFAIRLRYAYRGRRLHQATQQFFLWPFAAADTLRLLGPLPTALTRNSTDSLVYDRRGRLQLAVHSSSSDTLRRFYGRRYLLEIKGADALRLVLLGSGGQPRRRLELLRADSYEAFNRNPSLGDGYAPSTAEKYDWLPTDSPTRRLLKQWRLTVTDRRYHYDAAGQLQGFSVDASYNRHAVRRPESDSLDAQLAAQLLSPRRLVRARGLRRLDRREPAWPYRRAVLQRFTEFRYECY
jgi:YD repeat-containing protein